MKKYNFPNKILYSRMLTASFIFIIVASFIGAVSYFFRPMDFSDPWIEIRSPTYSIYNYSPILVEISVTEENEIDTIWYNWNGTDVIYTSELYVTFEQGEIILFVYANDTSGNLGTAEVVFTIDTIVPTVEIISPTNKSYSTTDLIIDILGTDNVGLERVWYELEGVNHTFEYSYCTRLSVGTHTMRAWASDRAGHLASTEIMFTIDTSLPTLEIVSPQNSVYSNTIKLIEISASDDEGIDTIWYNWNGTNVKYYSPIFVEFEFGYNTLNVWANDTGGNEVTDTITFYISTEDNFSSVWNTSKICMGSSSSNQVRLPLVSSGSYFFLVKWGDNTENVITSYDQPERIHTYALKGVYQINISGMISGWRFSNGGDRLKLMEIKQWGCLRLGNRGSYFYGCSNLVVTSSDVLNLTGTSDMSYAFSECSVLDIPQMNKWDVSSVTNMNNMFDGASVFNQNISNWNVSNVTSMGGMFWQASSFNQNITNWNVSSVTNMVGMFYQASSFNQNISNWDVSRVTSMGGMFCEAFAFNQQLDNWDVSSVTVMNGMFQGASAFNQSISNWNVSKVTNMANMFWSASNFNQDIGSWNVSKVTNMNRMFTAALAFNRSLEKWDVSNVLDMAYMFCGASSFNGNITNWNVSKVTTMFCMFEGASVFNQSIVNWDVSSVTNMANMFWLASNFNQNISSWDVSKVTSMYGMFFDALYFNQSIGNWNVSQVKDMGLMFNHAFRFNQNLSNWNVSNVINMRRMFCIAYAFNQNISKWNVSRVTTMEDMFFGITLSTANYNSLLIGWSNQNLQPGVTFNGGNSKYSAGAASDARAYIISTYGWTISDGGQIS